MSSTAAAAPQQKFEASVAKVCRLRDLPNATTDHINEAWAALRSGIVVVRKLEEVLDSRSEQEVLCVLEFLLQRGAQKRSARGQVRECLRVLLARPPWLAAALAGEDLRRGVLEALDGEQDAELIAQLAVDEAEEEEAAGQEEQEEEEEDGLAPQSAEPPQAEEEAAGQEEQEEGEEEETPQPAAPPQSEEGSRPPEASAAGAPQQQLEAEAAPAPKPLTRGKGRGKSAPVSRSKGSRPAEAPETGAPQQQHLEAEPQQPLEAEAAEAPKPLTIRERLAQGKAVLESFGWEFPRDVLGTRGDDATAGFQIVFEAVSALSRARGKAAAGEEPAEALADFEEDWANLLQFLISMYDSGVKRTYSARIRFVVVELRGFSPAFRTLAPWAALPWGGQLPMPPEEVEEETRAWEAFQRQRAEEAENLQLAQVLQAHWAAEELALEERRRQVVQEDLALACKLQEERPPEPAARPPASRLWRMCRRTVGGA